jgi:hypothetical protein
VVAAFVGAVAIVVAGFGRTGPGARTVSPGPGGSGIAASDPAPSNGPSLKAGGKLAQKLVAVLGADPFFAHIDETTVARSTEGSVTLNLTAKASGDISGKDVALRVQSTGGGAAVDQEVVAIGKSVWIRPTGSTDWEVHARTATGGSIDSLLETIRLVDDPTTLADAGIETVDGRKLHHLTASGSIAYRSSEADEGRYDRFDVWVTDAGVPVLMKGSFSTMSTTRALVGNVTIRYRDVGTEPVINPPSGAPTPVP